MAKHFEVSWNSPTHSALPSPGGLRPGRLREAYLIYRCNTRIKTDPLGLRGRILPQAAASNTKQILLTLT